MNGYERSMCMLNGGVPDRVPMMLHSFMPAAEQIGVTQAVYRSDPRALADAHMRFARKYDLDGMLVEVDTCVEADAMGARIDYPENGPAREYGNLSADFNVLRREVTESKIENSPRIQTILEAIRIMRREVGGDILIRGNCDQMGFSLAMLLIGMGPFMEALADEDMADDILDIIDRCTDAHIRYHRLMMQAGADITSFGDSPCGPDLISAEMYRTFAKPFHQKLKRALDRDGTKTVCHICGRLDIILEDVAGIGFAGVEIDYKTDMVRAEAAMRGHSAVFGPIDPSGVFFFGTPEKVAAETQKQLGIFGGRNLIIGAGCALPLGTPDANLRAFSDTVKAYRIPV